MTETQLRLLKQFWEKPEYADYGWDNQFMAPGQDDIYWIKCRYYDWLVDNNFMEGGEPEAIKYKTAREKTSGLYDLGLINLNHRLTEVGLYLLRLTDDESFMDKTSLGISKDSTLYLSQLLKLSYGNKKNKVRPFIVVLYLLSKLEYLTLDEFCYLMPLCTNKESTQYILQCIRDLREGNGDIDAAITKVLLTKENYIKGLARFTSNEFSEALLLSVGMNRKSANYDRAYVALYENLYSVYMKEDESKIFPLFKSLQKFQSSIAIKWKQILFDTPLTIAVKKDPAGHLLPLDTSVLDSDESFKDFFFKTMHLFKAKATLEDYQDLNKRYLGLSNIFIFEDGEVKLDIVPKHFFMKAIDELYRQAYEDCEKLEYVTPLAEICPALIFNERDIINGVNAEFGTSVSSLDEAYNEVDRVRYDRFNKLVNDKFSDDKLLSLLNYFDNRKDDEITQLTTDNADVPTIFEYVLGIIWWKASKRKGKILDFMKLSLDANLLPITHAAGGEADIVYEYSKTQVYPAHTLLLEATLADGTNQRRMEMEPVSRHLGNHLLRTNNPNSYCVFASTSLHVNVIGDFRSRKYAYYYDPQDPEKSVHGLEIIPLSTEDLRTIVRHKISYDRLYPHFKKAYNANEMNPPKWYNNFVCIPKSNLVYAKESRDDYLCVAEPLV